MDIISLIQATNLEEIIAIEEQDRQFLAIKDVRNTIYTQYISSHTSMGSLDDMRDFFLLLIVKNALISYQIAGSGELRWEEFTHKVKSDFFLLWQTYISGSSCNDWFYTLMTDSKYNKRLYNLKHKRLEKFSKFPFAPMASYYADMQSLQKDLALAMGTAQTSKTITFAVKMFGYAARVALAVFVIYPMSISIPVDSRLRKIFVSTYGDISDVQILEKAQEIAEKYEIPPLHLDSLLRVKIS